MWLVKLVDYFRGYLGSEVIFKNLFSWLYLFFTCNGFSRFFHIYSFELVGWKESLFFCTMQKTCDNKIGAKGVTGFLSWIHKKISLCWLWSHPQYFLRHMPSDIWTTSGLSVLRFLARTNLAYVMLCFNVLGRQWNMVLVCPSQSPQYPSDYFRSPLGTKSSGIFTPVQFSSAIASPWLESHHRPPCMQQSPPSHTCLH